MLTLPGMFLVPAASGGAQSPALDSTGVKLTPASVETGSKSPTSRLAESDPALIARKDATRVSVVVKLDYDSVATYSGTVKGLPATSPAVTGTPLTGRTPAEVAYDRFIAGEEAAFAAALAAKLPSARLVGSSLRTVYGGVRVSLPANAIKKLVNVDGVIAVQADKLLQPLTDSSSEFIGADVIQAQLGGASSAGEGVIFGVLDSGVWPEHPSFADQGNLSAPPSKADGTPRTCDFGDNPLTAEVDVFECNNKLISGEAFIDAYLAFVGGEVYETSRDSNGHGSHTASTAAGNALSSAEVFGVERGPINGAVPPRAAASARSATASTTRRSRSPRACRRRSSTTSTVT